MQVGVGDCRCPGKGDRHANEVTLDARLPARLREPVLLSVEIVPPAEGFSSPRTGCWPVSKRMKILLTLCGLLLVGAAFISLVPFNSEGVNCDGAAFMAFNKVQMPNLGGGLESVDGICGHDARMKLVFAGALGAVGLVGGVTVWIAHHRRA